MVPIECQQESPIQSVVKKETLFSVHSSVVIEHWRRPWAGVGGGESGGVVRWVRRKCRGKVLLR